MANAKADAGNATAADRAQKLIARPATPTNEDLAERAYEHYRARGGEHGHDRHRLRAERELSDGSRSGRKIARSAKRQP